MSTGIIIKIGAQTADAIAGINKVNKALGDQMTGMEKFRNGVNKAFVPAVAALSAMGVAAVAAAKKASDLAETQNKVGVIFGKSAKDLEAWAKAAPNALGQTEQAALDAAATMATFGKAAGLTGKELTTFSTSLVDLSADLASFHNADPAEVVNALGAALRGEAEPMRRFGVLINDAALKQRAMALGIYEGSGALTAQQKVLAAQAEILAQTGDAQGDFVRTSDSAANQMRIFQANLEQVQTELGTALLPLMQDIVKAMSGMAQWARENQTAVKVLAGIVAGLAAAIVAAKAAIVAYDVATRAAAVANTLMGTSAGAAAGRLGGLKAAAGGLALTVGAVAAQQMGLTDKFYRNADAVDHNTTAMEKWLVAAGYTVKELITGQGAVYNFTDEARSMTSATVAAAIAQGEMTKSSNGLANAADALNEATDNLGASALQAAGSYLALWESIAGATRAQRDFANTSGTVSSAISQGAILGPNPNIIDKWTRKYGEVDKAASGASRATGGLTEAQKNADKYAKTAHIRVLGDIVNGYEITISNLDKLSPKVREKLTAVVRAANDAIASTLRAGQQELERATQDYEAAFTSIRDSIRGAFDMGAIIEELGKEGGDWKAAWAAQVAKAKQMSDLVRELVAQGASEGLVQLIVSQGAQGVAWGQAIIKDGLVPSMSAELANVDVWAGEAGTAFADKFYGPGVSAATTMLNGINTYIDSQLAALEEKGRQMGLAIERGFNSTRPKAVAAGNFGPRALPLGGQLRSYGGATLAPTGYSGSVVNVTVNQTVGDPVAAAREIRRILNTGSSRLGVQV